MLQDYTNGLAIEEIMLKHGFNDASSVYYRLRKAGIKPDRRRRKYDCDDELFDTLSEEGRFPTS